MIGKFEEKHIIRSMVPRNTLELRDKMSLLIIQRALYDSPRVLSLFWQRLTTQHIE